jgi:hypothetical protein
VQLKRVKQETYTSRHFDVQLQPELLDAKLVVYITFLHKPGEGSKLQNSASDRMSMLVLTLKQNGG